MKLEPGPPGVIGNPLTEFPGRKDDAGAAERRELAGDHVVCERTASHDHLHVIGAHQSGKAPPEGGKLAEELRRPVRDGRTRKGRSDRGRDGNRTGQQVDRLAARPGSPTAPWRPRREPEARAKFSSVSIIGW